MLEIKERGVDIVITGWLEGLPVIIDEIFDTETDAEIFLNNRGWKRSKVNSKYFLLEKGV